MPNPGFSTSIFVHDSNPSGSLRLKYFKFIKILGLANKNNVLQIFSFMIDVFPPKMIFPDCPFKCNQRLTKILILTPWRYAHRGLKNLFFITWLRAVMHTAELDFIMWCTLQSLTPRWDAHREKFFKIQISWQNQNWIRKYFSLFYQGPRWVRIMEKKWR